VFARHSAPKDVLITFLAAKFARGEFSGDKMKAPNNEQIACAPQHKHQHTGSNYLAIYFSLTRTHIYTRSTGVGKSKPLI